MQEIANTQLPISPPLHLPNSEFLLYLQATGVNTNAFPVLVFEDVRTLIKVFSNTHALIACWLAVCACPGMYRLKFVNAFMREQHVWVNFLLKLEIKVKFGEDMQDQINRHLLSKD